MGAGTGPLTIVTRVPRGGLDAQRIRDRPDHLDTLASQEAQQGPQLRLVVGHQRAVLRSLELTGLDMVFALYKTVENAVADVPD